MATKHFHGRINKEEEERLRRKLLDERRSFAAMKQIRAYSNTARARSDRFEYAKNWSTSTYERSPLCERTKKINLNRLRRWFLQDDLVRRIFNSLRNQSDHFFNRRFHRQIQFEQSLVHSQAISIAHIELLSILQIAKVVLDGCQRGILIRLIDIENLHSERDARETWIENLIQGEIVVRGFD